MSSRDRTHGVEKEEVLAKFDVRSQTTMRKRRVATVPE